MKSNVFNTGRWLVIFLLAFAANNANAQTSKATEQAKTSTVIFTATDMGCGTDSKMVETALYRKQGVKSVKIEGETITIVYNPKKVKPEDLKTVIENTGTCEDPNAKVHKVKFKS